jgi:lipoate-protein ligase B
MVKKMVSLIETAIMDLLKLYDIESQLKDGATWLIKISVSLLATVSS